MQQSILYCELVVAQQISKPNARHSQVWGGVDGAEGSSGVQVGQRDGAALQEGVCLGDRGPKCFHEALWSHLRGEAAQHSTAQHADGMVVVGRRSSKSVGKSEISITFSKSCVAAAVSARACSFT
jgi:hypothetical protein